MNERILELASQAGFDVKRLMEPYPGGFPREDMLALESFAKLIVEECAGLCGQAAEENARTFYTVSETKKVGPALVAKGGQVQAEKLAKLIKKHFGVAE